MRILLLGGQGMLGHKIAELFSPRFDLHTTFRNDGVWAQLPFFADRSRVSVGVNALNPPSIQQVLDEVKPAVVINCIGIIKQLKAAKDAETSIRVNALFPHLLAEMCANANARLIHLSTDCVFSGEKGFYSQDDNPDPVDLYGRTKLLGEVAGDNCLTLRTSIIGRDYVKNVGLIEWFLSNRGGRVGGYTKAIYSGFTTRALALIMADIIENHAELSGVVQIASDPINKYELLTRIRDAGKLDIEIEPSDALMIDRSMNAQRFVAATGYQLPTWDTMIAELVAEFAVYDRWREIHGVA